MSIADQIVQRLSAEIKARPCGEYGEILFDDEQFRHQLEPSIFLEPEPDVFQASEHPQIVREYAEHPTLLGIYVPMHSPGRVILIERNLRRFYWSLIARLRHRLPYLFPHDLEGAAQLVIQKTYQHERFHFHCDVLRQLLGGYYDRLHEEALAVAWSRLWISDQAWNTKIKRMNQVLYHGLMENAYAYRSAGYRDWIHYADSARFAPALLEYLDGSANMSRLVSNGVSNLPDLFMGMVGGIVGGCVEEIV